METVDREKLIALVANLCQEANYGVREDVLEYLEKAFEKEEGVPKRILGLILENIKIAKKEKIAVCQDTGMTEVFLQIGKGVHIDGELLEEIISEGVAVGYEKGYLRKSVVDDPLFSRKNTENNTPPVVHFLFDDSQDLTGKVKITIFPRGFGAENMTQIAMLSPSEGEEGVKRFVIEAVKRAGTNPCPPIIVGIGIGGTAEKCLALSKKALLRPLNLKSTHPQYASMEKELQEKINDLEIGPQGFGGKNTCLGVNIEYFPTHIAGLPVAVSISCYALRQASRIFKL